MEEGWRGRRGREGQGPRVREGQKGEGSAREGRRAGGEGVEDGLWEGENDGDGC